MSQPILQLSVAASPSCKILDVHWSTFAGTISKALNLNFQNKLQQTTFPEVFFSVARNERTKKYPWVSEDDFRVIANTRYIYISSRHNFVTEKLLQVTNLRKSLQFSVLW